MLKYFFSMQANKYKMYALHMLKLFHLFGSIIIPFYLSFGHLNFFQIMILQVAFFLSIFLFEVPTGVIADKLGRKNSIALGFLISTIVWPFYGTLGKFWIFLIAEIALGFSHTLISGADIAIIVDSLKELGQEAKSKNAIY